MQLDKMVHSAIQSNDTEKIIYYGREIKLVNEKHDKAVQEIMPSILQDFLERDQLG